MPNQREKFERLKALHHRGEPFVIPNPWDAGSARLLTGLGFDALPTTSAGYAYSKGRRDSLTGLSRSGILENAAEIVGATHLPVSADLQDRLRRCARYQRLSSLTVAQALVAMDRMRLGEAASLLQASQQASSHPTQNGNPQNESQLSRPLV